MLVAARPGGARGRSSVRFCGSSSLCRAAWRGSALLAEREGSGSAGSSALLLVEGLSWPCFGGVRAGKPLREWGEKRSARVERSGAGWALSAGSAAARGRPRAAAVELRAARPPARGAGAARRALPKENSFRRSSGV